MVAAFNSLLASKVELPEAGLREIRGAASASAARESADKRVENFMPKEKKVGITNVWCLKEEGEPRRRELCFLLRQPHPCAGSSWLSNTTQTQRRKPHAFDRDLRVQRSRSEISPPETRLWPLMAKIWGTWGPQLPNLCRNLL